jgi:hypothetical protein
MTGTVGFSMLLAILCKENGILLPLFILIIEATLFRSPGNDYAGRRQMMIILWLPIVALCVYLLLGLGDEIRSYGGRPYTMSERLLTQTVVLCVYLKNLLLPSPEAFSLFHDDFLVSHGILSPPLTLASLALIITLFIAGFTGLKSMSVVSMGILWFLCGHLLESTYLNLELYFDHRNYLPAFGFFFVLAWLTTLLAVRHKTVMVTGVIAYVILITGATLANTRLWADPVKHMQVEVAAHPESPRALSYLAGSYLESRNTGAAVGVYKKILQIYPDAVYPLIKLLTVKACIYDKGIADKDWSNLFKKANGQEMKHGFDNSSAVDDLVVLATGGHCLEGSKGRISRLTEILLENPVFRSNRGIFHQQLAKLAMSENKPAEAVRHIELSSKYAKSVPQRLSHIEFVMRLGYTRAARQLYSDLEKQVDGQPRLKIAYREPMQETLHRLEELNKLKDKTGNNTDN